MEPNKGKFKKRTDFDQSILETHEVKPKLSPHEDWQNLHLMSEGIDISPKPSRQFETGAVRDSNEGKTRPDLISPYAMERWGHHMAKGGKNYGFFNWQKGIDSQVAYESLLRHVLQLGKELNFNHPKTDEDHASAILFNAMLIIHNEEVAKLSNAK